MTRVGAGPFPTELDGDLADLLVERGHEFGTNTGRRRRVGWFDAVMARQAARLNSPHRAGADQARRARHPRRGAACASAYDVDGERYDHPPYHQSVLHAAVPVYETLPGWRTDLSGATDYAQLPAAAVDYVRFLEETIGVPIGVVGLGPGREQFVTPR